jgi:hypothetical protein
MRGSGFLNSREREREREGEREREELGKNGITTLKIKGYACQILTEGYMCLCSCQKN